MPTSPAIFTLSLDTEIAWGTFDTPQFRSFAPHFDGYRPLIERLVALLDEAACPATWAFVGHLFLDACRREGGTTHPEVLRPGYAWYPHDWHDHDPGTDLATDPWWYGPDVLARVMASPVGHEIGSHTFSHIVVDDPACTADIVRSQLAACCALHAQHGLTLQSLVFPRNRIAHLEVLSELGLIAYRGREAYWYEGCPVRRAHQLAHLLDAAAACTPPTYPRSALRPNAHGLVNVPGSLFLMPMDGIRRRIPARRRVVQSLRGLRRAVSRGELFHLWFHPFNLGSDPAMFAILAEILEAVAAARDAGDLVVRTMAQVAEEMRDG